MPTQLKYQTRGSPSSERSIQLSGGSQCDYAAFLRLNARFIGLELRAPTAAARLFGADSRLTVT